MINLSSSFPTEKLFTWIVVCFSFSTATEVISNEGKGKSRGLTVFYKFYFCIIYLTFVVINRFIAFNIVTTCSRVVLARTADAHHKIEDSWYTDILNRSLAHVFTTYFFLSVDSRGNDIFQSHGPVNGTTDPPIFDPIHICKGTKTDRDPWRVFMFYSQNAFTI